MIYILHFTPNLSYLNYRLLENIFSHILSVGYLATVLGFVEVMNLYIEWFNNYLHNLSKDCPGRPNQILSGMAMSLFIEFRN